MASERHMDLDAIIEDALRGEPLRKAPPTLHRRVVERVRFEAMRQQEQTRFRYTMATLAVGFLAIITAGVFLVLFTNLGVLMSYGVSGGKGLYDYYSASMELSWSAYRGAYSLLLSVAGALAAVALGFIPLRKYLASG